VIDPGRVAAMDQAQAAFRTWAELLRLAQTELMKAGIGEETALEIAREWLIVSAQKWSQDA
jgi:hypothetical protein